VLVSAALLGGCRLGVAAESTIRADGGGTAAVVLRLDGELLAALDELGVDPTAELEAAATEVEGWAVTRRSDGDGLVVRLEHEVGSPAGFGDAYRDLVIGLSDADPALLVDLEVDVDEAGAAAVTGTVELRAPATAGIARDGIALGPDADRLAALTAEHVDAQLVIELPGRVTAHDADLQDGRTLVWQVPVGTVREFSATASPPERRAWWLVGLGAVALVVLVRLFRARDAGEVVAPEDGPEAAPEGSPEVTPEVTPEG
jgi:hypothetical protein